MKEYFANWKPDINQVINEKANLTELCETIESMGVETSRPFNLVSIVFLAAMLAKTDVLSGSYFCPECSRKGNNVHHLKSSKYLTLMGNPVIKKRITDLQFINENIF